MSVSTAVVLAAGEGTRLRPLTRNRPKPMLPAANRPILEHVLDALVDAGIEEICLVVGYKRQRVQEYFGPSYRDTPLTYVIQEKQLGSGHALLQARHVVSESMLVVNGDRVIEPSMVESVADAYDPGTPTLAVVERPDTSQYGAVALEGGRITELEEKPQDGRYRLINAGIYAFEPSIFEAIEETPRREGELALTDTLERRLDAGSDIHGVHTEGLWVDATYPWDLLTVASELLAHGRVIEPREREGVWVADSARVHPDASLQGPVVVGPDSEIAAGAVVGPTTALGRNVTVGANATVGRAVLDDDTRVGAGSVLRDTVTGQNATLGPATVVPGGPADVRVDDRVFADQELGAVFADRVRAVGDLSVAPGTLVGPGARLDAGVRIAGRIAEDARVVR